MSLKIFQLLYKKYIKALLFLFLIMSNCDMCGSVLRAGKGLKALDYHEPDVMKQRKCFCYHCWEMVKNIRDYNDGSYRFSELVH